MTIWVDAHLSTPVSCNRTLDYKYIEVLVEISGH